MRDPHQISAYRQALLWDVVLWSEFEACRSTLNEVASDTEIPPEEWAEPTYCPFVTRCWARCLSEQVQNASPAQIDHYMRARSRALMA